MSSATPFELASGAEARWTGVPGRLAVICLNGGTARELPGTWSASLEWLVGGLGSRLPGVAFCEVRYRIKSWRRLESCVEDAGAAIAAARDAGVEEVVLLGFSMGGAVAVCAAADPLVTTVVGLAPWLYPQLDLDPLRGRRLAILHGALDRALPGIPGVAPELSLRAAERARALGVDTARTTIPGALHAIALRTPWGRPVPMPRAGRWLVLTAAELDRLCA